MQNVSAFSNDGTYTNLRARPQPVKQAFSLQSSLDSGARKYPVLDVGDGTGPWYSGVPSALFQPYANAQGGFVTAGLISSNDTPADGPPQFDTVNGAKEPLDSVALQYNFNLYICAITLDPTALAPGAAGVYVEEYGVTWQFDGSGNVANGFVWQAGPNKTGQVRF